MRASVLITASFLAACSFHAGGVPLDPDASGDAAAAASDGGPIDASVDVAAIDAAPDAAPPAATITCSTAMINGQLRQVLTLGGDVESGFLGAQPTSSPYRLEYGSDIDSQSAMSSCPSLWTVPYDGNCTKQYSDWGPTPTLYLDPQVDDLNLAIIYADGTVRWGDLKTSDGDGVGFTVSGSGSGYDCRIVLTGGGTGGYVRIDP